MIFQHPSNGIKANVYAFFKGFTVGLQRDRLPVPGDGGSEMDATPLQSLYFSCLYEQENENKTIVEYLTLVCIRISVLAWVSF